MKKIQGGKLDIGFLTRVSPHIRFEANIGKLSGIAEIRYRTESTPLVDR